MIDWWHHQLRKHNRDYYERGVFMKSKMTKLELCAAILGVVALGLTQLQSHIDHEMMAEEVREEVKRQLNETREEEES